MATKKATGKDVESFRQLHDKNYKIPRQIKASLADLGDAWEYEADFIRRTGLSNTDFAQFRDDFTDFWFEVTTNTRNCKRIWCGTVKFANKLREYQT